MNITNNMTAKEYLTELSLWYDFYDKFTEEECVQELIRSHRTIRQTIIERPERIVYRNTESEMINSLQDKLDKIQDILDE